MSLMTEDREWRLSAAARWWVGVLLSEADFSFGGIRRVEKTYSSGEGFCGQHCDYVHKIVKWIQEVV